jgi:hypothetical protein
MALSGNCVAADIDAVCRTDNLSTNLWALCLAIIGYFYMVTLKR